MPGSQATTRSAWLQKSVSTKDILQIPLWGVGAPGWWKGYMGQGCRRQWSRVSLPEVAASSLHRHPGHSFESPNRCLVPLSPRSDGRQSKCGVLVWSCLPGMMDDRANVGCCGVTGAPGSCMALKIGEAEARGWKVPTASHEERDGHTIFSLLFPCASIMDASGTSKEK